MTCRHCRSLLSPYLDKRLPPGEVQHLQEHLARCTACTEHVRQLTRTQQLIRALPPVEVTGRMELRLLTALQQRPPRFESFQPPASSLKSPAWWRGWPLLSAGTVATCAASFMFYFAMLQAPPPVAAEEIVASMDQLLEALDPDDGHSILTEDTVDEIPLEPWHDLERGFFDDEDDLQ